MNLGIDLSSDIISYSFLQDNRVKTYYIKESSGFRTKNTFDNKSTLLPLLKCIKNSADRQLGQPIDSAVYSVPEYCSYFQRGLLRHVSESYGIKALKVMDGSVCTARALCEDVWFDRHTSNNDGYVSFIVSIFSDYAEITAFEPALKQTLLETFGTTTISFNSDLKENEAEKLLKRIKSELHQYDRDLSLQRNIDQRSFLFWNDSGCSEIVSKCFRDAFQNTFGIMKTNTSCMASKGAFLQAVRMTGAADPEAAVIYSPQNKTISACFGENGEFKKLIDYYTIMPTKLTAHLLVSTEPDLFIYEGNYLNRKYDTIIGEFSIPENLEGHEIAVTVDIDYNQLITVSVEDEFGNVIIPKALL